MNLRKAPGPASINDDGARGIVIGLAARSNRSEGGASHFRGAGHDVDLYPFGKDEAPLVVEIKSRKSGAGFVTLEKWLNEFDALFLRRNNADPIVVVPWRVWARILNGVRR